MQVADVHVLATVIKVWFRMMPVKLLSVVSPAEITNCSTGAQCMQVLQRFPPGHKGVVLWLLDLMADVADQQEHNKMNERAVLAQRPPRARPAPTPRPPRAHPAPILRPSCARPAPVCRPSAPLAPVGSSCALSARWLS